jgi:hypothetical protein
VSYRSTHPCLSQIVDDCDRLVHIPEIHSTLESWLTTHVTDRAEGNMTAADEKFIPVWNSHPAIHESARSVWTETGWETMEDTTPPVTHISYVQRATDRHLASRHVTSLVPNDGGEVSLTGQFLATVGHVANLFVRQPSNFVDYNKVVARRFMPATLAGSGTSDMNADLDRANRLIPPILFEHKPYFSFRDAIGLYVALSNGLTLLWEKGELNFKRTHIELISYATKLILAQVRHQLLFFCPSFLRC